MTKKRQIKKLHKKALRFIGKMGKSKNSFETIVYVLAIKKIMLEIRDIRSSMGYEK
jgi:hypothetical protein